MMIWDGILTHVYLSQELWGNNGWLSRRSQPASLTVSPSDVKIEETDFEETYAIALFKENSSNVQICFGILYKNFTMGNESYRYGFASGFWSVSFFPSQMERQDLPFTHNVSQVRIKQSCWHTRQIRAVGRDAPPIRVCTFWRCALNEFAECLLFLVSFMGEFVKKEYSAWNTELCLSRLAQMIISRNKRHHWTSWLYSRIVWPLKTMQTNSRTTKTECSHCFKFWNTSQFRQNKGVSAPVTRPGPYSTTWRHTRFKCETKYSCRPQEQKGSRHVCKLRLCSQMFEKKPVPTANEMLIGVWIDLPGTKPI